MAKKTNTTNQNIHSLVSLDDFKSLMGMDDRDDKTSRFCLETSTFSIEQYCKRRFLRKTQFEYIDFYGDLLLYLREYPVLEVSVVYALGPIAPPEYIEKEFYEVIPDFGTFIDVPYAISLSPALKRLRGLHTLKVVYISGYQQGKVPADLAAACMELAVWNFSRLKNKKFGVQEAEGKESLEMTMPENVRFLLEPYQRKTI